MKTVRLCAVGAFAALALAVAAPAGAEASDNASCVGQFASDRATSDGQAFGQQTANAADFLHPFGQNGVKPLAQADPAACPSIP